VNIAITGATGFLGNELVLKHLELGNSVRILTRGNKNLIIFPKEVQIFNGDLTAYGVVLDNFVKDVDVLYHCAAEIRDESKMYQVNVVGTQNLINTASGYVKHWVQLSSTGVYGNPSTGIITEVTPVNPKNIYEITKLRSDEIVIKAGNENKFSYTILRPSNVFGRGMKNQSLYQLIKAIDNGLFFFIGNRGASANYISVENVVNAMILCGQIQGAKGKIYNLSDWVSMEQFILLISNELNKPFPKIRLPKFLLKSIALIGDLIPRNPLTLSRVEALTNRCIYSSALIIKELNYSHCVSMEEGLRRLILFYNRTIKNSY
jgi:nucleoside-diphosphate-sugar epimerase